MSASDGPLFDPERHPEIDPRDAAAVVHGFLRRCRAWGTDLEIPKRLARVQDAPDAATAAEQAAKLHAWTSWVAFVDHALSELEDGTLDHWFTEDAGL